MAERGSTQITQRLVEFNLALKYESLPADVIAQAKHGVLDTLGVALVGSREDSTRMIWNAFQFPDGRAPATVLGTNLQAPPVLAALVNGAAAHALDYDDTQHHCGTHMSAPVFPSALAVAETLHRSGKDLLAAYVVGFEVGCKLGRVADFGRHLQNQGIHATGYLGHFGSVAASARLIGLDASQTRHAFGIAGTQAAGLMKSLGAMSKPLNAGKAAHNAVLSVVLAKEGFTGPEQVFDGEHNVFAVANGRTNAEELLSSLGGDFEIMDNTVKVYACAGWRNPIIEAMIKIVTAQNLRAADVKNVQLLVWPEVTKRPNYAEPSTGLEGKFSAQYAAAVAITDRAGGVAQFTDERVKDRALADLTRRVKLDADKELDFYQIKVLLRTTDGREFSDFIPAQKGDPRNPLTWDELVAKFRANATAILPEPQVAQLIALIQDLEKVADVSELTRLCRPASGRS